MNACSKQRLRYQSSSMSFICVYPGERFFLLISSSSATTVATAAEVSHGNHSTCTVLLSLLMDETHFPCAVQIQGLLLYRWKGKALSWPESRGARCDINGDMAGMRSSPEPGTRMLLSHSAPWGTGATLSPPAPQSSHHILLFAVYRHTSPLCLPQEPFGIYSHTVDTALTVLDLSFWAGQGLYCSLFASLSGCLNRTAPPFKFLSLIRAIFSKLFFSQ